MSTCLLPVNALFLLCLAQQSLCEYSANYEREKGLVFDFYLAQKLSLPKGAMNKTKLVEDNMDCVFSCVDVHWCRSINFKIAPQANGLHACQLISSDQFTGKQFMEPDKAYNHYSVKNPCQENPCSNGGNCTFQVNRQSHHCKCPEGFEGDQCQKALNAPKNCTEVLQRGGKQSDVYTVDPDGKGPFQVFCDQTTTGGGWAVFQKRKDGSIDFYRDWNDYKNGFGDLRGEFWLGLDKIYRLTSQSRNRLRVELEDTSGSSSYAEYDLFAVSSEQSNYTLSLGTYAGTAGDSLSYHKNMAFSTKDRDNDRSGNSCALNHKAAWWYRSCHYSSLNGHYNFLGTASTKGVCWYHWKNKYYSYKRAEMKMIPA